MTFLESLQTYLKDLYTKHFVPIGLKTFYFCISGHNIFELCISLLLVRFAPRKVKRDMKYEKLHMRGASSLVAEQLKLYDLIYMVWSLPHGIFADGGGLVPTQEKKKVYDLRKIRNIRFIFGWRHTSAQSPFQKSNLGSSNKKSWENIYQNFLACSVLPGFLTLFQLLCLGLYSNCYLVNVGSILQKALFYLCVRVVM